MAWLPGASEKRSGLGKFRRKIRGGNVHDMGNHSMAGDALEKNQVLRRARNSDLAVRPPLEAHAPACLFHGRH